MSPDFALARVSLPFRIGARTVGSLRRRLVQIGIGLDDALSGIIPPLPPLPDGAHGYQLFSVPVERIERLQTSQPHLRTFVRQRYRRSFASLSGSFDEYLDGFSTRSRSTLKRKVRKLADASGGTLDVRRYAAAS